jgi:hypothetical protein
MTNRHKGSFPESSVGQWDSLNCDVVGPTDVVEDTTVRPMRESLRKRLQAPRAKAPPQEPPQEKAAS